MEAKENDKIKCVEFGPHVVITHILFVDDLLLLGPGNVDEWKMFKENLDYFSNAIGIEVNHDKFIGLSSNFEEKNMESIKGIFPLNFGMLNDGLKYLGYFLTQNYYRVVH